MPGISKVKILLLGFTFFVLIITLLQSCADKQTPENNTKSNVVSEEKNKTGDTEIIVPDTNNNKSDFSTNTNIDWLLVPGKSAGQTRINENADSVYKRLGTPDGGDAAMQKAVAVWFAHHDTTAYSVSIYTARNTDSLSIAKVLQIRITSPSFKTKEGIHVRSSLTDIQKAFPVIQTEHYLDAGINYTVYDSKQGIAFEVNSNDTCVAIIIHKAGVVGEGTHLKFRTTNRFINRKQL